MGYNRYMDEQRHIEVLGSDCRACGTPFGVAPPGMYLTVGWSDTGVEVYGLCFPCVLRLDVRGFWALFTEAAELRSEMNAMMKVLA